MSFRSLAIIALSPLLALAALAVIAFARPGPVHHCVNEGSMTLPLYVIHGKRLGGFTETVVVCHWTDRNGTSVLQQTTTDVPGR